MEEVGSDFGIADSWRAETGLLACFKQFLGVTWPKACGLSELDLSPIGSAVFYANPIPHSGLLPEEGFAR